MNNKDILKTFGLNVKFERMKQGLTQAQLAELIDVHEKHICKIETGHQNITLKTLNKIASALNIEWATLLEKK